MHAPSLGRKTVPEDEGSRFLWNAGSCLQNYMTLHPRMGMKLYNKIPNKIREVGKMRQFKKVMRSYLIQHTFYSVEDYMSN
jgi:hypothetical protein